MILLKFLKQQNWWYGVPCLILLYLYHSFYRVFYSSLEAYNTQLAWTFLFSACFLVFYSFKFANKQHNLLIDRLKLFFYFAYFTVSLLSENSYTRLTIQSSFPYFVFFLYFYTLLIFYKRDMEEQGKTIKKSYWLFIVGIQSFMFIGVVIWAITQKVEAEKQKVLALAAKEAAVKSQKQVSSTEKLANEKLELVKEEVQKYKLLYDSLKQKK